MYHCDICGRPMHKKKRCYGRILCSKHMHQFIKYGKFLDNNPRTVQDLNAYRIRGNTVIFDLYDHRSEKAGEFLVDLADIEKVKYHKWRFSHGRVVTGQPAKGQQRELSHIILDIPRELDAVTIVDHINGDPRDSRRDNLRICTQAENLMNKKSMSTNTSGFIGVTYDAARNRWAPEIRAGYVRCHLGRYRTKAEAVFARLVAEELVFAEFANEGQKRKKEAFTASLCPETKAHIRAFVTRKLADKNLGHQLCGSSGYAE